MNDFRRVRRACAGAYFRLCKHVQSECSRRKKGFLEVDRQDLQTDLNSVIVSMFLEGKRVLTQSDGHFVRIDMFF